MDLRRAIIGRKRTPLVAAAVTAAGIGIAAALPAYATSDDPAGESPMPQDMTQMHEQMMQETPGMARMHDQMMRHGAGRHGGE